MPLFGKRPSSPPSPGPSTGPAPKWLSRPSQRPGSIQKPVLKKPVPKPAPEPKGIFGGKGYRSFREIRGFARKAPYKRMPGYGEKPGKERRAGIIKTLQEYSGKTYGLRTGDFDLALKKMRKDRAGALYKRDYVKRKKIEKDIKQLEAWKKEN